jgi:hypothetical protein
MTTDVESILGSLHAVENEREKRRSTPSLEAWVTALKRYQQRRFTRTYSDLLQSTRYAPAARFFLEELYGPGDFSRRDGQFARVVPALVRLFPREIVDTVGVLGELHALSESLDTAMALRLGSERPEARDYVRAWNLVGQPSARDRQIVLTLDVGASLDRLTRKPLLRRALHLMRAPARAAGLGELQTFLESGFDTFQAMKGAEEFLLIVSQREHKLAAALFASHEGATETGPREALPNDLP